MLFVDRALQSWPAYVNNPAVNGRPFATTDSSTPNLEGSFWIHLLDTFGHLLLPTISLILISFASYTRYTRASMLEVLNQDYIRTARSKGLTERTVIMRHAFRNALMPLASIVPVDIITLVGGAIITETVFNWSGMGHLFVDSLDPQPAVPGDGLHHDRGHPGGARELRGRPDLRRPRPADPGRGMSAHPDRTLEAPR